MLRSIVKPALLYSALALMTLCVVFACAGTVAQAETEDARGVHSHALTVAGIKREFSYYVPGNAEGKKRPVVIYLHGYGDNMRHMLGKGLVSAASSHWMKVAERERFFVFYPLGLRAKGVRRAQAGWNDCRRDAKSNPKTDDVEFIKQLIEFAVETHDADRSRVYVTGMSNGGHMTMRVAIEMSEAVAAVATVAASLPKSSRCLQPSRPVPILLMHGTADPIAPFNGGAVASGRGEVLSARETVNTWIQWNGLETVPENTIRVEDITPADRSRITARVREASVSGIAVIAYEMRGAGHTEPSRVAKMSRLLKRVQGNQNQDVEMAEVIWDFFKTRSR